MKSLLALSIALPLAASAQVSAPVAAPRPRLSALFPAMAQAPGADAIRLRGLLSSSALSDRALLAAKLPGLALASPLSPEAAQGLAAAYRELHGPLPEADAWSALSGAEKRRVLDAASFVSDGLRDAIRAYSESVEGSAAWAYADPKGFAERGVQLGAAAYRLQGVARPDDLRRLGDAFQRGQEILARVSGERISKAADEKTASLASAVFDGDSRALAAAARGSDSPRAVAAAVRDFSARHGSLSVSDGQALFLALAAPGGEGAGARRSLEAPVVIGRMAAARPSLAPAAAQALDWVPGAGEAAIAARVLTAKHLRSVAEILETSGRFSAAERVRARIARYLRSIESAREAELAAKHVGPVWPERLGYRLRRAWNTPASMLVGAAGLFFAMGMGGDRYSLLLAVASLLLMVGPFDALRERREREEAIC